MQSVRRTDISLLFLKMSSNTLEYGFYLEHGSDVLNVSSRRECGVNLTHSFNQSLGCLCHLFHLLVIQKSPLLFILKV